MKQVLNLEKKLVNNKFLKALCVSFMKEYCALGYMSRLQKMNPDEIYYFPPHLSVLKKIVHRLCFE